MRKIEKFMAKSKEIEIEGETLEIHPLKVGDIDLLIKAGEPKTAPEAIKEILRRTLARTFPDAKEEEIDSFGLQHLDKLIAAIGEVNDLDLKVKKV